MNSEKLSQMGSACSGNLRDGSSSPRNTVIPTVKISLPEKYKVIVPDEKGQPTLKEFPIQHPSTNQVLVRVEFTPLCVYDNGLLARGAASKDPNARYGSEGSGIVVEVGKNLKRSFKVGDRVHVRVGCWAQYLLANSEEVFPILHKDLSLEDACAHWINPATVHYMGAEAGKGGHKAVIQTAAGSVLGRMAIRYFKLKGIKTINVVRRDDVIEELKKEGADYVLNSQAAGFEDKLKELAEKENATLAFDAVAGDFTNVILKNQPPGSTILVYGLMSGWTVNNINIMELFKQKTLGGLVVSNHIAEYAQKGELEKLATDLHKLLPTVFKSHIHKIFKIDDIKEAFAYFEENSSKGKIIIQLN